MKNSKCNLVPYEVIERAIKRKAAYGCFEVPNGLSTAEKVAKPKTAVKDKLRASRPCRLFPSLLKGNQEGANG